ncbi:MAG: protein-glutamate O-methyltransferase family protein [Spirochaetales bacterium]|jgi:uncharacterized protein with ATP-grasp and redox domains|nr:protein-glutamate O-methyltransferase family protein [Spirochaetales bacterium]
MSCEKPLPVGMSSPDSFARYTFEKRFPSIIQSVHTTAKLKEDSPEAENLKALLGSAGKGEIRDPFAEDGFTCLFDRSLFLSEELTAWREEIARYAGLTWREAPFYFAEAYLYLNILIASGYYTPTSGNFRVDPYQSSKEAELARFLAAPETGKLLERFEEKAVEKELFADALLFMLKANRIDLSNAAIAAAGRELIHKMDRSDLLVDHTDALAGCVYASGRVDIILDNAGAELAADLVFVRLYLASRADRRITLHAKASPTFVSDAMPKDIAFAIAAMKKFSVFRKTGEALEEFLASGRLKVLEHYFWNGPKHFPEMPPRLREELCASDICILKGDANFRRLIEDRAWPFDTDLSLLTSWFPGNFAVLRTLKSEVAADIPPELSARLNREDPSWLTNGRWGYVRLVGV